MTPQISAGAMRQCVVRGRPNYDARSEALAFRLEARRQVHGRSQNCELALSIPANVSQEYAILFETHSDLDRLASEAEGRRCLDHLAGAGEGFGGQIFVRRCHSPY